MKVYAERYWLVFMLLFLLQQANLVLSLEEACENVVCPCTVNMLVRELGAVQMLCGRHQKQQERRASLFSAAAPKLFLTSYLCIVSRAELGFREGALYFACLLQSRCCVCVT